MSSSDEVRRTVETYMDGVLSGVVPAGRFIRLAVERQVRDMDRGRDRGLYFDEAAGARAVRWFGQLRHSKGEWAGQVFQLAPWQQFRKWVLCGWKREEDGYRRFRTSYDEVPRKNGKSTDAAGTGLYFFAADDEPGAEVFNAATKRDQARIVHAEAIRMVKASPGLSKRIRIFRDNLHIEGTASKFEPLGADADTADGLNIHAAIVDELHAHKTRALLDVLDTATGARRQPMIYIITTAGHERLSVCWETHDYAIKVLEGVIEDDTFFAFIATIDKGDDWRDEAAWARANPNLGISVKLDDLRRKCKKAIETPGYQNAFRRLHLNEWTEQVDPFFAMDLWDACGADPLDPYELAGEECYGGLDLASKIDTASFSLDFIDDDSDVVKVLTWVWVPEARARKDKRLAAWIAADLIKATEGDVIDFEVIREDILAIGKRYRILEIGFDPWNATQLATQLEGHGCKMIEVPQTMRFLSEATKDVEARVVSKRLAHGGNPVLRWMASNCAGIRDSKDNVLLSKKKSTGKIDGVAAFVTAHSRRICQPMKKKSVYETRGLSFV